MRTVSGADRGIETCADSERSVGAEFGGLSKAIAGAISVFALGVVDLGLGPLVIALAAWLGWLIAFALASSAYFVFCLLSCEWILARWDPWILTKSGAKLERKLDGLRNKRLLKYPAGWLTHGSIVLFTIASALLGAVFSVAVVRWESDKHVSHRRVIVASIAAGLWFGALNASIGAGIGAGLRAG
jgi:hypothetical protein